MNQLMMGLRITSMTIHQLIPQLQALITKTMKIRSNKLIIAEFLIIQ